MQAKRHVRCESTMPWNEGRHNVQPTRLPHTPDQFQVNNVIIEALAKMHDPQSLTMAAIRDTSSLLSLP